MNISIFEGAGRFFGGGGYDPPSQPARFFINSNVVLAEMLALLILLFCVGNWYTCIIVSGLLIFLLVLGYWREHRNDTA